MLIISSIKDRLVEGVKKHDTDIRGDTIQNLKGTWPPSDAVDILLRMQHIYWRVSNQQWGGAPVIFMMVLAQALIVLYLHSAGF